MAGKSKERQALADRVLPFEVRVVPAAVSGGAEVTRALFEPLGYRVTAEALEEFGVRELCDLRIAGEVRLRDLLSHLCVLVPVPDNAKHWWIDRDEIEKRLAKGAGWPGEHPAKELIARRALKRGRRLVHQALARLGVVTTSNRDDNALLERMAPGQPRHPDHRFERTRAECEGRRARVADTPGYRVRFAPLGPLGETHGAPSQMAVFERAGAA